MAWYYWAAAAAVKVIGAVSGGQQAIQQAKAERDVGQMTANANEESTHANDAQRLGEQRAAAAQSGFDPNSGSFLQLQQQSAGNAFLGELNQRYQGQLASWRAYNEIKSAQKSILTGGIVAVGQTYASSGMAGAGQKTGATGSGTNINATQGAGSSWDFLN